MDVRERFVAAFNAGDLDAIADCLAEDAVARVDGAPFPEERGRRMIRETSLPYLRAEQKLRARVASCPDGWVALVDADGRLDVAIELVVRDDAILSLRYVTEPHRPAEFARLASLLGR